MTIVRDINTKTMWIEENGFLKCAVCDGNTCVCCCCDNLMWYLDINLPSVGDYDFCPNCFYFNGPDFYFGDVIEEDLMGDSLHFELHQNLFHPEIQNYIPPILV